NDFLKGNTVMRKLVRNALVAGAATTAAVGLAATPSFADTATWNINPNSTAFSATSTNPTLTNPRNQASLTCTSVTANGTTLASDPLDSGTVHATAPQVGHNDVPDTVAPVTSSAWWGCMAPLGLTFNVAQVGTWNLQATSENLTTHEVKGQISNVTVNLSGACTATMVGTVRGTYDNNTKTLTANEPGGGNLLVTAAACYGFLIVGDRPAFSATFAVTGNITVHRNH
ncbi:hypothetical protein SAMN04489712_1651, partial [Thermomonospora echinospora]